MPCFFAAAVISAPYGVSAGSSEAPAGAMRRSRRSPPAAGVRVVAARGELGGEGWSAATRRPERRRRSAACSSVDPGEGGVDAHAATWPRRCTASATSSSAPWARRAHSASWSACWRSLSLSMTWRSRAAAWSATRRAATSASGGRGRAPPRGGALGALDVRLGGDQVRAGRARSDRVAAGLRGRRRGLRGLEQHGLAAQAEAQLMRQLL